MRSRSAARARFLGLWSAGWLALLLGWGILRFGDPAVQWPVLLVPALWALVALRPRRRSGRAGGRRRPREPETVESELFADDDRYDDRYDDEPYEDDPPPPPPGTRTDTVERPALRRPHDPREHDRW